MTLIAYAYAAAAEVALFIRDRALFTWGKLARDTVIASAAFAYSVWAIWGSGEEWLAKGFMLLLFGIPVFVWMKWRTRPEPLPSGVDPDWAFLGHGPDRRPARAAEDVVERRVPTAVS
jgi:amino acid transporter